MTPTTLPKNRLLESATTVPTTTSPPTTAPALPSPPDSDNATKNSLAVPPTSDHTTKGDASNKGNFIGHGNLDDISLQEGEFSDTVKDPSDVDIAGDEFDNEIAGDDFDDKVEVEVEVEEDDDDSRDADYKPHHKNESEDELQMLKGRLAISSLPGAVSDDFFLESYLKSSNHNIWGSSTATY